MANEILPIVQRDQLKSYLGERGSGQVDIELEAVCEAVTALIVSYVDFAIPTTTSGIAWPADIALGAKMLAARLYRRRNSPGGVESLGELGPVYVSRNDPDLAQLLRLGRFARPQVG